MINVIDDYCNTYKVDDETKQQMQILTGIVYGFEIANQTNNYSISGDILDIICGGDYYTTHFCCMQSTLNSFREILEDDITINYFSLKPFLFDSNYVILEIEVDSEYRNKILELEVFRNSLL